MPENMVSMRELLGPHLPYLRRHARALAGSQRTGDEFVRAALETLVDAPESLPHDDMPRVALFRLFHAYWLPHRAEAVAGTPADTLLAAPHHPGREALLLTVVEGFSDAEAARILRMDESALAAAVADARAAIAAAIRSRVLIIEDEPVISMHLEQITEEMGHEVVATAMTREEAVREAERVRPDLVLADIQLADGSSGIDAVRDILGQFDIPVIFITAYPERLLTGERPEPTYLVTKPFEPDTVIATVGQALLSRQQLLSPA
jgi:CheY-like chemotaxis protein